MPRYAEGEEHRPLAIPLPLPSPLIDPEPAIFLFHFIHRMEDAKKGTGGGSGEGEGGVFLFLLPLHTTYDLRLDGGGEKLEWGLMVVCVRATHVQYRTGR